MATAISLLVLVTTFAALGTVLAWTRRDRLAVGGRLDPSASAAHRRLQPAAAAQPRANVAAPASAPARRTPAPTATTVLHG